mmetsp:Transcript_7710/g.28978  ORF Transcript_7710/g.28978 Transcript_7710/m.28978 type:complete len:83 (+) Transcript_7710:889-1137(+)
MSPTCLNRDPCPSSYRCGARASSDHFDERDVGMKASWRKDGRQAQWQSWQTLELLDFSLITAQKCHLADKAPEEALDFCLGD